MAWTPGAGGSQASKDYYKKAVQNYNNSGSYGGGEPEAYVPYGGSGGSGDSGDDNKGAYIASTQGGTNTQGTPPAVDPQGGDGNPVESQLEYIISQKDKLKVLPHSTNPELNKYQEIMNNFRLSNPEAYKKKFPFSAGLMNLMPLVIKKLIPGSEIITGIASALNTAKKAKELPVVKEGIQMLTDLVYDPTVNLYNTVAAGTPGKTETDRIFTPGNLPGVSPHYDAPDPKSNPMKNPPSSSPTEMVTETDLSELVFDPTADQIRAMQMFGGTDVGSIQGIGSGPVMTDKGKEIVNKSNIDGVVNKIDPLVDLTQEDLVNLSGTRDDDVDESVIVEETEEGTPQGMQPGAEAEAAVDNTLQNFIDQGGYTGSLLNPNIVTNTDPNFDTGVYDPASQQYLNILNSLSRAHGGIASFANGGYNYINGNTMNNESLTASANIDDRIMKNLQFEKMAPGMMGYKNGGLTSLNNSDYNKLKSTYQYMGDF